MSGKDLDGRYDLRAGMTLPLAGTVTEDVKAQPGWAVGVRVALYDVLAFPADRDYRAGEKVELCAKLIRRSDLLAAVAAHEAHSEKSEEWTRIASEPSTDEEIASYKRHEGCDGSCLGCLEKFRLIVRLEAAEAALLKWQCIVSATAPDGTHCRSCCYLEAPCDACKVAT